MPEHAAEGTPHAGDAARHDHAHGRDNAARRRKDIHGKERKKAAKHHAGKPGLPSRTKLSGN